MNFPKFFTVEIFFLIIVLLKLRPVARTKLYYQGSRKIHTQCAGLLTHILTNRNLAKASKIERF